MRIWSLHPSYLDYLGLNGQWREALQAQNLLFTHKLPYYHHSAMTRIKAHRDSLAFIGMYLHYVNREANEVRGYHYNTNLIVKPVPTIPLPVTRGQLYYEWTLLQGRLQERDPQRMALNDGIDINTIKANPMFYIIDGNIESWEKIKEQ